MEDSTAAVTQLIELANQYVELASMHLRRNWDISTASQLRGFDGIQEFRDTMRVHFFFPDLPPRCRKALMDLRRAKFEYDAAREPYREPLTPDEVAAAAQDLSGCHRSFQRAVADVKGRVLPLLTPVQQQILRRLYLTTEHSAQDLPARATLPESPRPPRGDPSRGIA